MDSSTTSRLAGIGGILFVVTAFLGLGGPYFDDPSNEEILSWVRANPVGLCVQGLQIGVGLTLIAALIAQLVLRSGRRGPLAIVAIATIAADLAVDWVSAAVNFALADSGKRAGADDAVLALFSLAKEMTFADGFLFGLAVTAVSALSLRARSLPAPLAWLGVGVGYPVEAEAMGLPMPPTAERFERLTDLLDLFEQMGRDDPSPAKVERSR